MLHRISAPLSRRAGLVGAGGWLLAACGEDKARQAKSLKVQVQDRYGAKDFAKGYELAVEGLPLAREALGDTHPDTLYFAQAVSEMALGQRNMAAAARAMKVELELRTKAGQSEQKLQPRRTLLIKLAEEAGDTQTAVEQTVLVAKGIDMKMGKDPQPTYRPENIYPPELYTKGVQGDVELSFNLDPNGTPVAVRVVRATPPNVFDTVAVESFKKWRFTPFIENGAPVSSVGHTFTLAFRTGRTRG